jgi:hypothetical protein
MSMVLLGLLLLLYVDKLASLFMFQANDKFKLI